MSDFVFFFFKQKTAYEMRISDWSSDVCSSDLPLRDCGAVGAAQLAAVDVGAAQIALAALRHIGVAAVHHAVIVEHHAFAGLEAVAHQVLGVAQQQIGRASGRERVGQYVEISVVAGSLKKKKIN